MYFRGSRSSDHRPLTAQADSTAGGAHGGPDSRPIFQTEITLDAEFGTPNIPLVNLNAPGGRPDPDSDRVPSPDPAPTLRP